jgi:uncharacterized protein
MSRTGPFRHAVGIQDVHAGYPHSVREQILEAELYAHELGDNPRGQVLTRKQAGRNHCQLKQLERMPVPMMAPMQNIQDRRDLKRRTIPSEYVSIDLHGRLLRFRQGQSHAVSFVRVCATLCIRMAIRIEWDENKNRTNIAKHGIGFADVLPVFSDPLSLTIADREVHGESRYRTIGAALNCVVLVAHTLCEIPEGDELIRIISARYATSTERTAYEEGE